MITANFAAAQLGAAALSAHFRGHQWEQRIELPVLDMRSPSECVLGQVFGTYKVGMERLALDEVGSVRHGFELPPWYHHLHDSRAEAYSVLGLVWWELLNARLTPATPEINSDLLLVVAPAVSNG